MTTSQSIHGTTSPSSPPPAQIRKSYTTPSSTGADRNTAPRHDRPLTFCGSMTVKRITSDRYSRRMIAGVIAPGHGYGPQAPLLDLAGEALADRSAAVETINWTVPDGLLDIGPEPFVRAHVAAALHRLSVAARTATPVIIAKSTGRDGS